MKFIVTIILITAYLTAPAQNSVPMTLVACEQQFLEKNLLLLAEQYNISAKQALVTQSRAYPNPVFSADFNVYDPQNKKYFHVDSTGQKAFQIEQLILLGGKRKTEIALAKQNQALAESEFADLLRHLRVQLHSNFFSINSGKTVIENYDRQLQILDTIIGSYKVQTDKGNLPLKDIVRLKSVYIKISGNRSEIATDYNEQQKQLKLLLRLNTDIIPVMDTAAFNSFLHLTTLSDLENMALANRPDLKIADQSAIIADLNLQLWKKQRIPDISVNTSYDQRGGAFTNQVNAGIAIPLPVFNTNRGNIRAAGYDKQAQDLYLEQKKLEVELDIQQAWANMQRDINEYSKIRSYFNDEFTLVNTGINTNFQKRNISILEFVDHVEAYNESLADFERIKKQLAISAAMINYVTASKIY